ncbi:MAG: IMPACT family protein [Oscillospiraceae bacterium]|nr:IMPACT family protein [Oscillospiraceae bacterium]
MKEYKALARSVCAEYVLKRSRFLCYTRPVTADEDALAFIKEISAKHWDARHNVWAYVLREGARTRYSDDGEPQGTAGLPVLEALRSRGITDSALVVTRYFGGILLGASGLARAYSQSAALGIEKAGITSYIPSVGLRLCCTYSNFSRLERLVAQMEGVINSKEFGQDVEIELELPISAQEGFIAGLGEISHTCVPETVFSGFIPVKYNAT